MKYARTSPLRDDDGDRNVGADSYEGGDGNGRLQCLNPSAIWFCSLTNVLFGVLKSLNGTLDITSAPSHQLAEATKIAMFSPGPGMLMPQGRRYMWVRYCV